MVGQVIKISLFLVVTIKPQDIPSVFFEQVYLAIVISVFSQLAINLVEVRHHSVH